MADDEISPKQIFSGLDPEQWHTDHGRNARMASDRAAVSPLEDPVVMEALNRTLAELATRGFISPSSSPETRQL